MGEARQPVVFGNVEGRLPSQPRGYYHEDAVAAPNAGNRGARRFRTGRTPVPFYYENGDTYRSFQTFEVR